MISEYPRTANVLLKRGFHCVFCPAAANETIEKGAKAHGKSDKEIIALVKELEEVIKNKKEGK